MDEREGLGRVEYWREYGPGEWKLMEAAERLGLSYRQTKRQWKR